MKMPCTLPYVDRIPAMAAHAHWHALRDNLVTHYKPNLYRTILSSLGWDCAFLLYKASNGSIPICIHLKLSTFFSPSSSPVDRFIFIRKMPPHYEPTGDQLTQLVKKVNFR